jgi:hypothetical protein
VKNAALVAVVLNFLLLAIYFVSSLWDRRPLEWESLLPLMELGAFWALLPLTVAIPSFLWRWSEGACFAWSLGYLLLITDFVILVTSPGVSTTLARPVAPFLFLLGLSAGMMAFGWLQRKSGLPSSEPRTEESRPSPEFSAPTWLGDGLDLVYRQVAGFKTTFSIAPTTSGYRVRMRDEERIKQDAELAARRRKERERFPDLLSESDEQLLRALSEEWHEFDLVADSAWEFMFIREDLNSQGKDQDAREQELGKDLTQAAGGRYTTMGWRELSKSTCGCVDIAQYLMFWVGPGRCWRCAGILSKLRRCKECRGTGQCERCLGDGVHHWQIDSWYEANTGLLLRRAETRNGKRMRETELESATPDILAPYKT